jgi:hypothetical protein
LESGGLAGCVLRSWEKKIAYILIKIVLHIVVSLVNKVRKIAVHAMNKMRRKEYKRV